MPMTNCPRTSNTSLCSSRWSRRLTNFHPWREGILQKDASCSTILSIRHLITINSWMRTLYSTTWRHWMMMPIWSLRTITSLKMMTWNSLTIWMFLSSSCSWIEEIVYALKSTATLPRDFSIFVHWILKLDIWKSGKHLVSAVGTLASLSWASMSRTSWTKSIIYTLSLLHLSMCCRFRSILVWMTSTTSSGWKRQHVLVMISSISRTILSLSGLTNLLIGYTISSLCSILRSLYHWWQL